MSRWEERLLAVLLAEPDDWHLVLDLCRKARVPHGWAYPDLRRLQSVGWVDRRMQTEEEAEGFLPTALYKLTDDGYRAASRELARAAQERKRKGFVLRPAEST